MLSEVCLIELDIPLPKVGIINLSGTLSAADFVALLSTLKDISEELGKAEMIFKSLFLGIMRLPIRAFSLKHMSNF